MKSSLPHFLLCLCLAASVNPAIAADGDLSPAKRALFEHQNTWMNWNDRADLRNAPLAGHMMVE